MYGVGKPQENVEVDSHTFRQWFQSIYRYVQSRTRVVSKTAAYSVESDVFLVRVDTTSAGFTVMLPPAATYPGRQIAVKKIDASANNVTVDGDGSETIDGAATKVWNTQYLSYTFISNGTNWDII